MQVVVAAATSRRQLLRKDFGMQPVKLIHAPSTPIQPAFSVKQPAFSVRHQRGKGHLPVVATQWQQNRRQLAVTACTKADSDLIYGDINFDCKFTFVQVCVLAMHGTCSTPLCCLVGHILLLVTAVIQANEP